MHLQLRLFLPPPCPPSCSCDKKLLKLGWQEKTSWEEGLRKTVDWYLQNAKRDYWCAPAASWYSRIASLFQLAHGLMGTTDLRCCAHPLDSFSR